MNKNKCEYCKDQAEPGRIETDNNGPIVDCPVCRPKTRKVKNDNEYSMRAPYSMPWGKDYTDL